MREIAHHEIEYPVHDFGIDAIQPGPFENELAVNHDREHLPQRQRNGELPVLFEPLGGDDIPNVRRFRDVHCVII